MRRGHAGRPGENRTGRSQGIGDDDETCKHCGKPLVRTETSISCSSRSLACPTRSIMPKVPMGVLYDRLAVDDRGSWHRLTDYRETRTTSY
jgi:hypothetical protein